VRLVGDNACESDRLDAELVHRGVELIAPHRRTRTQRTRDGRALRRYQRRWKIERLVDSEVRRIVVRHERLAENFLAMLHIASCLILLRCMRWILVRSMVLNIYCPSTLPAVSSFCIARRADAAGRYLVRAR
jgi:hypothetical protein